MLGQAKWVSCIKGEIRDYIVDLRHNSETFGQWASVILSEDNGKSVIIPTGFGHAFEAHSQESIISYALTSSYDPKTEMTINPFDATLNITWELNNPRISERDRSAPTLKDQVIRRNIQSDNL
jgi:dTDP-4-dehydrorhamnose 3,5-epimerase